MSQGPKLIPFGHNIKLARVTRGVFVISVLDVRSMLFALVLEQES
jgi:hypothetical protein